NRSSPDHINLAVKRVAPGVIAFCLEKIEKQIAACTDDAARVVADAHAVLTSLVVRIWRVRVDKCDQLPSARCRIELARWSGIEIRIAFIASEHFVKLRGSRIGMPRI